MTMKKEKGKPAFNEDDTQAVKATKPAQHKNKKKEGGQ